MDLQTLSAILSVLISGGPPAVIGLLVLVIVGLWTDRRRLLAELSRKDARLDAIFGDYRAGALSLSEALSSLREVLHETRGRIDRSD